MINAEFIKLFFKLVRSRWCAWDSEVLRNQRSHNGVFLHMARQSIRKMGFVITFFCLREERTEQWLVWSFSARKSQHFSPIITLISFHQKHLFPISLSVFWDFMKSLLMFLFFALLFSAFSMNSYLNFNYLNVNKLLY